MNEDDEDNDDDYGDDENWSFYHHYNVIGSGCWLFTIWSLVIMVNQTVYLST